MGKNIYWGNKLQGSKGYVRSTTFKGELDFLLKQDNRCVNVKAVSTSALDSFITSFEAMNGSGYSCYNKINEIIKL